MAAINNGERKHAPDFSNAENEAIIKEHFARRSILEGKHSTAVSQKKKQAAWAEILAAVDALSTQGARTLEQVKVRQRRMFSDWKSYKAQLAHPPTGGGPLPASKPFYEFLEDLYAEDCRVGGVLGNGIEVGAPLDLKPTEVSSPSQILFETQQPIEQSTEASATPSDDEDMDNPNYSIWRDKPKVKDGSSCSNASVASGSITNSFASPSLRKMVAKRRLTYDVQPVVGKSEEAFMKVDCLELQKKILLQTQMQLEKEAVNEDLRYELLKKQRLLIDMQLRREFHVQKQMRIINEEEQLNAEFFEAQKLKEQEQAEDLEEALYEDVVVD